MEKGNNELFNRDAAFGQIFSGEGETPEPQPDNAFVGANAADTASANQELNTAGEVNIADANNPAAPLNDTAACNSAAAYNPTANNPATASGTAANNPAATAYNPAAAYNPTAPANIPTTFNPAAPLNGTAACNPPAANSVNQPPLENNGAADNKPDFAKGNSPYPQYQPYYGQGCYAPPNAQPYQYNQQYGTPQYQYAPAAYAYPYYYAQPEQPKKKKGRFAVRLLLILLGIALVSTLAIVIIKPTFTFFTQFPHSNYEDEAERVKQPTYKGEKPELSLLAPTNEEPMTPKEIYNKIYPSIVEIYSYDEYYEIEGASYGSGMIISEDGYILTNAHVLYDSYSKYRVVLHDGSEYDAMLVGADNKYDIGIIKIDAAGLTAAELCDGSRVEIGDRVYTIGNPNGPELKNTFSEGVISGLDRSIVIMDVNSITYFQTDAGINPGNSGGPLVNEHGQVIGINVAKIVGYDVDSLGFSIPIHKVMDAIDQLFEYGTVKGRAKIGATFESVSKIESLEKKIKTGLYIRTIDEDSNLMHTQFDVDDVITHINRVKVDDIYEMQAALADAKPGDNIAIEGYRINEDGSTYRITDYCKLQEYIDEF